MRTEKESDIAQASTIANSRILDVALPIFNLIKPILQGFIVLLPYWIPAARIHYYLRDLLNDKVITRGEIIKGTNAPLLGEVGHSADRKSTVVPR
jgi:hypothetical protein